jgi:pyruvate-formate lyase
MIMNERINRLRTRSLAAVPSLSDERARLLTRFFKSGVARTAPVPVQRARAFASIMENKKLFIGPDELIVGERGPAPKATPTYPEVCIHSQQDLAIIHERDKVAFTVDDFVRENYRQEIIPYWQGHSVREKLFSHLSDEWKDAYAAGIFTEFQEQRSPGHTACGDENLSIRIAGFEGTEIRGGVERAWIFSTTVKRWKKRISLRPWPLPPTG